MPASRSIANKSQDDPSRFSLDRISELAGDLSSSIDRAIEHITDVNEQTRLLSFNAQIEAARAGGQTGAAFAVVAQAIQQLSERTSGVAAEMRDKTQGAIAEVNRVSDHMAGAMRGTRLTDLALNNIDLIDRNLYERTCDVRWWATDAALVDALTEPTPDATRYAGERLGVILSAYTVYHDLVLTTLDGQVIANGRPDRYASQGANAADAAWFRQAVAGRSGDDYGFEAVHASPLVDRQRVLAYSCTVRERGHANGKPLGVLGVLFNWDDLAQVIVKRTPLAEDEWPNTRVCIADDHGLILADSQDQLLTASLEIDARAAYDQKRGFLERRIAGRDSVVAHALAPGYETYTTGWHSVIVQALPDDRAGASRRAA
ncbi:MAG: methyl-accepting chemotaxis protein [Planctomycetota bacterium]